MYDKAYVRGCGRKLEEGLLNAKVAQKGVLARIDYLRRHIMDLPRPAGVSEGVREEATLPLPEEATTSLQRWREIVLVRLSTFILVVGVPSALLIAWHHWQAGRWWIGIVPTIGIPLVLLVRFGRTLSFRLRAALQVGVFLVGGIIGYLLTGLAGGNAAVLVTATVLSALLLGARWALAVLGTTVAVFLATGLVFVKGGFPIPDPAILDPALWGNWLRATVFYLALASTILAVVLYLLGRLEGSLCRSEELVRDLRRQMEERELLESRLRDAEKARAVGTLAAGIAHDFNNILAGLMAYAEFARGAAPKDSEQREDLDQVLKAASRAKSLVARILAASRKPDGERGPVRIQAVLDEVLSLLRATVPANIAIECSIDADCPPILGDPTQVHQLIMNLCTNACQAMRNGGGVLAVGLRQHRLSPAEAAALPGLSSANCAEIRVRDTGCGMDEATKARIFEPYFTTRRKDEGTGLGLATVSNIVRSASGAIEVISKPGEGTTFLVLLPLAPVVASPQEKVQEDAPSGRERVLLVDDETQVLNASCKALTRAGYRVIGHTSPQAALRDFEGQPDAFDLIVTDLNMPDIDGLQIIRRVRERRPHMRVVICTGVSTPADEAQLNELKVQRTLIKPVAMQELVAAIRDVLDA